MVVPTRGRPVAATELVEAFRATCTADTTPLFAVDESDPAWPEYERAVELANLDGAHRVLAIRSPSTSMVEALNTAVRLVLDNEWEPAAIGFLGDDHRPRSHGWDRAYLDALAAQPGIVYGNDLIQGEALPTQCAMSTVAVQALGHMAPPVLRHLYVDSYWLALGRAADCITYLPGVVVEHVHPIAGKVPWDEGHLRVNAPALYERDRVAFEAYWAEHGAADVRAVRAALAVTVP